MHGAACAVLNTCGSETSSMQGNAMFASGRAPSCTLFCLPALPRRAGPAPATRGHAACWCWRHLNVHNVLVPLTSSAYSYWRKLGVHCVLAQPLSHHSARRCPADRVLRRRIAHSIAVPPPYTQQLKSSCINRVPTIASSTCSMSVQRTVQRALREARAALHTAAAPRVTAAPRRCCTQSWCQDTGHVGPMCHM